MVRQGVVATAREAAEEEETGLRRQGTGVAVRVTVVDWCIPAVAVVVFRSC